MNQYMRHIKNGTIYPYNELLVNNVDLELVDEKTAFPEKFAAKAVLEHKQQVDIKITEEVVAPPYTPPELGAQLGAKFKNVRMASDKQKAKSEASLKE